MNDSLSVPVRFRKRQIPLLTISVIALGLAFGASCSQKSAPLTRVTVAGETNMKAQPDAAVVALSVITQGQQALNAQQDNARKSDVVIEALKAAAGSGAEIKTSDYSLQPQFDYRNNKLPKIIGYDARNSVMVTIGDLSKVGAVIDAASRAGANSVDGVTFILRDNSPVRGQALAEASRQALKKAESIAQSMGGRVVRVVEEQEAGTASTPQEIPREMNADMTMVARQSTMYRTPVQSAPLQVNSRVQLVVEIQAKL